MILNLFFSHQSTSGRRQHLSVALEPRGSAKSMASNSAGGGGNLKSIVLQRHTTVKISEEKTERNKTKQRPLLEANNHRHLKLGTVVSKLYVSFTRFLGMNTSVVSPEDSNIFLKILTLLWH